MITSRGAPRTKFLYLESPVNKHRKVETFSKPSQRRAPSALESVATTSEESLYANTRNPLGGGSDISNSLLSPEIPLHTNMPGQRLSNDHTPSPDDYTTWETTLRTPEISRLQRELVVDISSSSESSRAKENLLDLSLTREGDIPGTEGSNKNHESSKMRRLASDSDALLGNLGIHAFVIPYHLLTSSIL